MYLSPPKQENEMVRNMDAVVFIPSTPKSALRIKLQEMDDFMVKAINSPAIRFVERGGPTLMDHVGRSYQRTMVS